MSGVAIYIEGGGQSKETRAQLRIGMTQFLRSLRDRRGPRQLRFKVVACGGRDDTWRGFSNASVETSNFLLVDSETRVVDPVPIHLARHDRWDVAATASHSLHLMVQVMETWLVADPSALRDFYGSGFHEAALPRSNHPEDVDKATVLAALERATRGSRKGTYHKIHHAGPLLSRLDAGVVRARCTHCDRLFIAVEQAVDRLDGAGRSTDPL